MVSDPRPRNNTLLLRDLAGIKIATELGWAAVSGLPKHIFRNACQQGRGRIVLLCAVHSREMGNVGEESEDDPE